jgi:hypothetical protein
MFVKVLAADNSIHHVNTGLISQVVEVSGMLRVHFSFAEGNETAETSSFSVKDEASKAALLLALYPQGR